MSNLMTRPRQIERTKRLTFLGVGGAGVFSALFFSSWLGFPLLAGAVYLGWDWLKFRAKNGMRF
jgi:hypothetical protein